MKTSENGLEFIKKWEKLELVAYADVGGVLTIGYGHTGKDVFKGQTITEPQARDLLAGDLAEAEHAVNTLAVPVAQWEFDALVSFVFNEGAGNFRKSTLLLRLNQGKKAQVPQEFFNWVLVKGSVSPGLRRRRMLEACLFATGNYHLELI